MKRINALFLFLCLLLGINAQSLLSPDGNLKLIFQLDETGCPTYALQYKNIDVIKTSKMGFALKTRRITKRLYYIVITKLKF